MKAPRQYLEIACDELGGPEVISEVFAKTRGSQEAAERRHVAVYVTREAGGFRVQDIAVAWRKTHQAVSWACSAVEERMSRDPEFRARVGELVQRVKRRAG